MVRIQHLFIIFYYTILDINECAERCSSGLFFLVRVFLYFSILTFVPDISIYSSDSRTVTPPDCYDFPDCYAFLGVFFYFPGLLLSRTVTKIGLYNFIYNFCQPLASTNRLHRHTLITNIHFCCQKII